MEKTIFVTVAEFIENGGKLNVGRQLFGENIFNKKIELTGTYAFTDDEDYIVYNTPTGGQSEDGDEYLYLKITCTPRYV